MNRAAEPLSASADSRLEVASAQSAARPASPLSGAASGINIEALASRLRMEARTGGARTPAGDGSRTPTAGYAGSSRPVQDGAILAAVRRQMEALEEKLGGQITRVSQQSERLREVALNRVDSKMGTMESLQPRMDRRLAELSGNYKGLSDEMQAQIRRSDQLESRLYEWRQQLDEEIRGRVSDIEQSLQQTNSTVRVNHGTCDELLNRFHKRLQRLEQVVQERVAKIEEHEHNASQLHDRISSLEETSEMRGSLAAKASADISQLALVNGDTISEHRAQAALLETQLMDACKKIDHLQQEMHEHHARVEAQEERLKTLRTIFETKEEHYRWLSDRVERTDWEGKFKDVQLSMQDLLKHKVEHNEKLELVQRRVDNHETLHLETADGLRNLHNWRLSQQSAAEGEVAISSPAMIDTGDALQLEMKSCLLRVSEVEGKIDGVEHDMQTIKSDLELAPRVIALVQQLEGLAPKVIAQENSLKDLHEKVGRMDVAGKLYSGSSMQGSSDVDGGRLKGNTAERLMRLEEQVHRLVGEIEGSCDPGLQNGFGAAQFGQHSLAAAS
eukprot:TRINITY_DN28632_c0_g1_i3.p1 TRINITY_DN28632_c0_g1~~TRINITY_DN28632_c0_g1_i3.p1  ORF type:complete len:560 (+),score=129.33 TRINITY_DN28632_c0_g1_i3:129-1808(+)